jgi:hypothetical protein
MTDVPVVTGLDGKTYPRFQLSAEDRDHLIEVCHDLARQGMSVRRIKQVLADHGLPRSVGSIVGYLGRTCEKCRDQHHALDRDQLGLIDP